MMYNLEDIKIRIMDITHSSSVDGTGFRDVLFVNYCPHHCEGCHNPETWSKENGTYVSLKEVFEDLTKSSMTNVTFSGGEPFEQAEELYILACAIKDIGRTIWIYSGYTFEQLMADDTKRKLLSKCDVLVDGKFDKTKTELNLKFRGSLNQRIIDIQKSMDKGEIVLFDDTFC